MADLLFKKKEQKPIFEAKECIEWLDADGKERITDIKIYTKDLLKAQDIVNNTTYKEQMEYIKNVFFKLDFDVDEDQLLGQFIEVTEYLKKELGSKFPR